MATRKQISGKGRTAPVMLVMHDVEEVRDSLEALLRVTGFSILSVRNETEAIEKCRIQSPDLILISLRGSTEEVKTVAQRVRSYASPPAEIPIVIFCVPAIPEGAELVVDDNIHFVRPDNFDQLRTILHRLTST